MTTKISAYVNCVEAILFCYYIICMTASLKAAAHEHKHLPGIIHKERTGYLFIYNHFTRNVNRYKNISILQLD